MPHEFESKPESIPKIHPKINSRKAFPMNKAQRPRSWTRFTYEMKQIKTKINIQFKRCTEI